MTFQVIRQTTRYDRSGNRIISRTEDTTGSFDTAGFALAAADHIRSTVRNSLRTNTVVSVYARHASGRRGVNETEALCRELYDDATVDRLFPRVELPF